MNWINLYGLACMLVIMVPNIIFAVKNKDGFQNLWSNKTVEILEQVGSLCFKGLDKTGTVEIGYGIEPGYGGKGLTTEAVTAMAKWADVQPGVLHIEAETEPENAASQAVLQKSGFVPNGVLGEEGPRFEWRPV